MKLREKVHYYPISNYTPYPYIESTLKRQELINRKFEIENEQKEVILSNLAILQLNSAKHMLPYEEE